MSSFEVSVEGLVKFYDKLENLGPKIRQEVKAELYQFGEQILAASARLVPVQGGALMGSGKVLRPVEEGNEISVTIGYGDESVGYALYVHEALEGSHPINPNWSWAKAVAAGKTIQWTRPGSGPKYLETPFKERQANLPGRIAEAVKRALA